MGDFLIGIGILLAVIGPLLLIPIPWALYRFVARPLILRAATPRLSQDSAKGLALGITVGLLAAGLAASYIPGKHQFDALCEQHAHPALRRSIHVDGFYADKLFAYQAAQYLTKGFTYIEAPDPYKDGVILRYTLSEDGQALPEEIAEPASLFGYRETFSQPGSTLTLTEKLIYERSTGEEVARAASVHYMGGPFSLLLGSYASSSCPDPATPQGSEDFNTFYNLETLVLRRPNTER